jgi:hypothetical protein
MEQSMAKTGQVRAAALSATLVALTLIYPAHVRAASGDELLISSIATGGGSASDEYVVIEAVGAGGTYVADYELVYTTATGATTRQLASLDGAAPLLAGARLLIANHLGSFSAGAFATWSEGIASTGGAVKLRLRAKPSQVADAVSWGSASASAGGFGSPAAAMSATTMIERRRTADSAPINTQSNSADFALVAVGPPNLVPILPGSPPPTIAPTALPTMPTPPSVLTPSAVRTAPLGGTVTVRGTVSAAPGELAEARLFCIEERESGIGVFVLAQSGDVDLVRGDLVTITGTLLLRRQALTVAATSASLVDGWAEPRTALSVTPPTPGSWAWEAWEARTIQVSGRVSGAVKDLAGGSRSLSLRLHGGGELLVGVTPQALDEIPEGLLDAGESLTVGGVLHQRAGTAGGGYRLWALSAAASLLPPQPVGSPFTTAETALSAPTPKVPQLQLGTPSVALTGVAQPGWALGLARLLTVRGGTLTLAEFEGVGLVVLPSCGEAQPMPEAIRAGRLVDRAGRTPYPQPR